MPVQLIARDRHGLTEYVRLRGSRHERLVSAYDPTARQIVFTLPLPSGRWQDRPVMLDLEGYDRARAHRPEPLGVRIDWLDGKYRRAGGVVMPVQTVDLFRASVALGNERYSGTTEHGFAALALPWAVIDGRQTFPEGPDPEQGSLLG